MFEEEEKPKQQTTIVWASLGKTPQKTTAELPPFASVWMVIEEVWNTYLKSAGYQRRSDRHSHPGISCLDRSKHGLHSEVKLLYGSSSNFNRSRRYLFEVLSPIENDANHKTYFGAYAPLSVNNYQWENKREQKEIYQSQTSRSIKIDKVKFQAYLRDVFHLD